MLLIQLYIRKVRPFVLGYLTRVIYAGERIKIGKGFRTDSVPRIMIDTHSRVIIGDNVEFRRNVELRAHGNSEIVIGPTSRIDRGVRILSANNSRINIGDKVRIGLYSVLNGGDSISIGSKSLVSGFVYLQTSMHAFGDPNISIQDQGFQHKPVVIERNSWLGTHVVIMPGVTIGEGAVVGSNAVVTKSVKNNQVVAGIPAKVIKERI